MPTTTRYSWTIPTEGGDSGTWDTILNTLFAAIDEQVFQNARDLASINDKRFMAGMGNGRLSSGGWFHSAIGGAIENAVDNPAGVVYTIQIPVRVGQRITGFTSYGARFGNRAAQVSLWYSDVGGGSSQISAGHSLPLTTAAETTTGSLTHDVLANRFYFIQVAPSGGSVSGDSTSLSYFKVSVITTP